MTAAGLRVLITNVALADHAGTELYARDLALELARQGHAALVYSRTLGAVAAELRASGVRVTGDLVGLRGFEPDIIHGHHARPALLAMHRFPRAPAIYVCHDHTSPHDAPPLHPRIRRHFAVSQLCLERVVEAGVPRGEVRLVHNFVDLARFRPRAPLPERPRRALIFSNYASHETHVPAVAEACRRAGLELDVVGRAAGGAVRCPEEILGRYDVVFAKAKAALEAMAVGAAVVLCDFGGVGPMVTADAVERLRPMNFGFQTLRDPLSPENVLRQLERYDAAEAARVRDRVRATSGLEQAVRAWVAIYQDVIAGWRPDGRAHLAELSFVVADAAATCASAAWQPLRRRLRRVRLLRDAVRALRRIRS